MRELEPYDDDEEEYEEETHGRAIPRSPYWAMRTLAEMNAQAEDRYARQRMEDFGRSLVTPTGRFPVWFYVVGIVCVLPTALLLLFALAR